MGVLSVDFTMTSNGSSKDYNVPLSADYMFYVVGDLGGGMLSLECSPDNLNWFTVEQVGVSARLIRYLVSGERVRITLSNSTSPSLTTGIRQ